MLVYLVAFFLISAVQVQARTDVIRPPVEPATMAHNIGDQHHPHGCAGGQFMRGFQQKIEQGCPAGDCTGLTSIRILCGTRDDATYQASVTDYEGRPGDWGKEFICPKGTFVNQFQLYSQKYQGYWHDDMGAGAISARCEGQGPGTPFLSAGFEAKAVKTGSYWSEFVGCPSGSVGCALSTNGKSSFPDNTEITNTMWYCCTAPPAKTSRQLNGGSFMEELPAERFWENLPASVEAGAVKAGRELWNKLTDEEQETLEQVKEYVENEIPAGK